MLEICALKVHSPCSRVVQLLINPTLILIGILVSSYLALVLREVLVEGIRLLILVL